MDEVLRRFIDAEHLALDIETTALKPHLGRIVTIAVSNGTDTELIDVRGRDPEPIARWLKEAVYTKTLVIHNAAFDLAWLAHHYDVGYPEKPVWDTMLAEQLLVAGLDLSAGLAETSERRIGVKLDKTEQTSFIDIGDAPLTEEQIAYAKLDAEVLIPIAKTQAPHLTDEQLVKVWQIEQGALPVFAEMQRIGIFLDRERMDPLVEEARAKMETLAEKLEIALTPHVEWKRIERFEAEQAELDAWLERFERAKQFFGEGWDFVMTEGDDVSDWDPKWLDQTVPKGQTEPKGRKKYVKDQLKQWRLTDPRPAKPKLKIEPINLGSWQQVHAALADMGLDLRNDQGKPTTQAKLIKAALPDTEGELREILQDLLDYKKCAKLVQAFGERLAEFTDDESRLHGGFRQIGTATGRPTCSEPNLLQMPNAPKFRGSFIAGPCKRLIIADYSQMELRLMAELSQDPVMVDAFLKGLDLHKVTAAGHFTGGNLDLVTDDQRKVAKIVNFGILYGMAERKLRGTLAAERIYYTLEEARHAIEGWHNLYAVASRVREGWAKQGVRQGYTTTALGRRRRFAKPRNRNEQGSVERRAANHVIQGSNADITKLAMAVIQDLLAPVGGKVVLQVYDEIVVEVPEEHAIWAAQVVKEGMIEAAKTVLRTVPAKVDCFISPSWNEKEGIALEEVLELMEEAA
ncbi:DNA polymerase [Nitrolancea hollandica]|uniref:DNA polymerase I n=1 Tax=Nitrolancea hollandica Lb TaxID=1129897 RepID=I4EFK9_9BACT|nr:DNA polymerase [Nitrolancea hollandica]CCF83471.1 putative DNA polymerase I [Nitrolancea hollandica Lb]